MQKLSLIGGSYSARSVIANAQRCLNLFPEANRKDSTVPVTHYQRPGLVPLATGVRAIGTLTWSVNPSNGETITLNGVVWTFVSGTATGNQTHIAGTLAATLLQLVSDLNASVVTGLVVATYVFTSGSVITIWYDTVGVGGNSYTLAASVATPSAATLLTGIDFAVSPALGRCLYRTSDGAGYCVAGDKMYYIDSGFNLILLGTLTAIGGTSPCSMVDNGVTLVMVDGTPAVAGVGGGYTVTLATHSGFAVMNDAAWTGATRVDYIDTFIVWNQIGTRNFGSTLSNQVLPLDATYVAGKVGWPDPLQSIIVNKRQIILPGSLKSEIWYDAGNNLFPFAELQGSYIEHGTVAPYSIAAADENVYMLSGDLQGQGYVLRHRGTETKRISNYALEYQIRKIYQAGGSIADAVGYTYQVDGHLFYVLNFPSGNQTWVWDESVSDPDLGWSQRGWTNASGDFNRDRGLMGAWMYGKNVVIDWQYGFIYEQSMTTYTDTVAGQEYPIVYLRTFPHLMTGTDPSTGQVILGEGKMIQHDRFQMDVTVGTGVAGPTGGAPPVFMLRWSDDRGQSWGNPIQLVAGEKGKFSTRPDARGLGSAMDRVYEISWSFIGEVALNGAWVEGRVLNN